jgi:hypothetical protein
VSRLNEDEVRRIAKALADELEDRGMLRPGVPPRGQGDDPCDGEQENGSMDPISMATDGESSSCLEKARAALSQLRREPKQRPRKRPSSRRSQGAP